MVRCAVWSDTYLLVRACVSYDRADNVGQLGTTTSFHKEDVEVLDALRDGCAEAVLRPGAIELVLSVGDPLLVVFDDSLFTRLVAHALAALAVVALDGHEIGRCVEDALHRKPATHDKVGSEDIIVDDLNDRLSIDA